MSFWVNDVPRDFGIAAAIIALAILLQGWGLLPMARQMARPTIYIATVFVIYLCFQNCVRVSMCHYNSAEEVKQFLHTVQTIASQAGQGATQS